jgi:hypothetical protein
MRASSTRFNQENPHSYGVFRDCRSQAAQQHGDVAQGPAATSLNKVKKVLMRRAASAVGRFWKKVR